MRTKHCTLIGRARCVSVKPIALDMEKDGNGLVSIGVVIDRPPALTHGELEAFAAQEGFNGATDMAAFFYAKYGTQMAGELITWADFVPAQLTAKNDRSGVS